ncbi:MAG: AsmA family protein, partial [Myxococcota bacterium]
MGAPKDPVSSSPVRSRWTKTRWWLGGLVGLFIVVAAGVAMLPWVVTPAFVRAQVERALQDDLGLPIEVGALSYHPFTGLSLSNIRVKPPPGFIRTPLRVAQLSVRYRLAPLLWGEVVVDSVTLEEAALVYESRDGRDNLTALIDGINAALGPSEPTPPRSELGPLMPITVRLQNIALGPISVELAADTSAKVSNLWIRGTSRLGTRAFTASVAVSLEPGAPNVSFHRPEAGGAASDSTFTARLKWPVSFLANTGAGFALGTVESDFDLRLTGSVNQPSGPLPPVDAALSWSVAYVPKDDRVALSGLRLALNEETLVDASASATGLSTVVQALVGTATASALVRPLGLPTKASDDRIELAVEQLNLPLSDLFPLAQVFVPNLVDAGGAIHARQLRVAGAVSTLRRGVPPELTGRLVAEQARCRWPGVVDVEQLDGALEAGRSSRGRYRAKGWFELQALNVAEQQL